MQKHNTLENIAQLKSQILDSISIIEFELAPLHKETLPHPKSII